MATNHGVLTDTPILAKLSTDDSNINYRVQSPASYLIRRMENRIRRQDSNLNDPHQRRASCHLDDGGSCVAVQFSRYMCTPREGTLRLRAPYRIRTGVLLVDNQALWTRLS